MGAGNNVAGLKQRINKKRSPVRNEVLKSFFVQRRGNAPSKGRDENENEKNSFPGGSSIVRARSDLIFQLNYNRGKFGV